jgi:hypothetical protein
MDPLSDGVKSGKPRSASALFSCGKAQIADFGKRYADADPKPPASHAWLREPLAEIAALFRETSR